MRDDRGSATVPLLLLGIVLILLAPFAVAASDVPLGLTEVDAAAGGAARVAAAERSPDEARAAAQRAASELLRRSRCKEGTSVVDVDVSAFEGERTPNGSRRPGMVSVRVECTIPAGRRVPVPGMTDSLVRVEVAEAVDPFRASNAR